MGEVVQFPRAANSAVVQRRRVNQAIASAGEGWSRIHKEARWFWRSSEAAIKSSRRLGARGGKSYVEELGLHMVCAGSSNVRAQARATLQLIARIGINPVSRRTAVRMLATP